MNYALLRHRELQQALIAQCELSLSNTNTPLQLQVPVADLPDLPAWLHQQTERPRFFWTDRYRSQQVAAAGAIQSWSTLEEVQEALKALPASTRIYGGWGFNPNEKNKAYQKPWKAWPKAYFFLPRWEVRQLDGSTLLCLNLSGDTPYVEQIERALKELSLERLQLKTGLRPKLESLHDTPDIEGWREMLTQAQQLFTSDQLEKIVLSKVSCGKLAELKPQLMQRLLARKRQAYHFWFEPFQDQVLWGASPERLYTRQGRIVKTEALAGTRPCPEDEDIALAFRDELLHSPKEQQENERVQEHLESQLGPLSSSFWMEPLTVIQAGPVQHLYRQIKAEIHPHISDAQLVNKLHPTPAVSGFPSGRARKELEAIEPHERGWYTGALGWISQEAAEWTVILRVALWENHCMHFYTGAGIMPDSDPDAEWEELEAKLLSLKTLFY